MATRRKFDLAFAVDSRSTLSLQHQLRQKLIDAINRGVLRPGRRLPSSRQLAEQAGVSRNTVTLAYDALLAEGHLISRPRSGIFVASDVQGERITTGRRGLSRPAAATVHFAGNNSEEGIRRPPNWDQYPFPFLDGCIDASLLAIDEWRESLRLAFAKQAVSRWSIQGEHDDPLFVEELRTKWLPAWGIDAAADEVIVAASPRHAMYLSIDVLVQRNTPVLLAEITDNDVRRQLIDRQAVALSVARGADILKAAQDLPPGGVIIQPASISPTLDADARDRAHALLQLAVERDALIIEVAAALTCANRGVHRFRFAQSTHSDVSCSSEGSRLWPPSVRRQDSSTLVRAWSSGHDVCARWREPNSRLAFSAHGRTSSVLDITMPAWPERIVCCRCGGRRYATRSITICTSSSPSKAFPALAPIRCEDLQG